MTYKKAIKSLEELKCYLPSEFTEKTTSYIEALDTAITVLERYSEKSSHLMSRICDVKRLRCWEWNDMIQGESD